MDGCTAPATGTVANGMTTLWLPVVTAPAASVMVPVNLPTATTPVSSRTSLMTFSCPATRPVPSCSVPVTAPLTALGTGAASAGAVPNMEDARWVDGL